MATVSLTAIYAYSTVDDVAHLVVKLGRGSLLAKVDIESAYRLIPVHPSDWLLLAVQWEDNLYVDLMLPFGLRSAPKIFNAVADALAWHLHSEGIPHIRHYLDDFIIIAPPASPQCGESLAILDRKCQTLGVPIADHKRDAPDHVPHLFGHRDRHQARLPASPRRQTSPAAGVAVAVGGKTDLHMQGARITNRAPQSRMQGRALRESLPEAYDRPPPLKPPTPELPSTHSAEPRVPGRPGMVEIVPRILERSIIPPPTGIPTSGQDDVRCLWFMGMWGMV